MYRIDKFLKYYKSLEGCSQQISSGVWVNAKPLDYPHHILTKGYWEARKQRKKDAKAVLKGKAIAVTWKGNKL